VANEWRMLKLRVRFGFTYVLVVGCDAMMAVCSTSVAWGSNCRSSTASTIADSIRTTNLVLY